MIAGLHHYETWKRGFIYSLTGDNVIQIFPDNEHTPKHLSALWALALQADSDYFFNYYIDLQRFRVKRTGLNIYLLQD